MSSRVLDLHLSIEIDKRSEKKFRQGFNVAPAVVGENGKQITSYLAPSI